MLTVEKETKNVFFKNTDSLRFDYGWQSITQKASINNVNTHIVF